MRNYTLQYRLLDGDTHNHPLSPGIQLVGSCDTALIQIQDQRLEHLHFKIRNWQGKVFVADVGSSTGTFLNGERLQPYDEQQWHPGHPLTIADLSFELLPSIRVLSKYQLGVISIFCAFGLLLIAEANNRAYQGETWARPIYWMGMVIVFLPIAARLLVPNVTRLERIGLLLVLAFNLSMVKIIRSPLDFTLHDELLHRRIVSDIQITGVLYSDSPLLPIGAVYPGLHIITDALVSLTGLDIFTAGLLVIGIGRIVLVLSLFLLYERLINSAYIASLATLIYMCEPSFVFFDGQFAYQSLAIPLAVFLLFLLQRRQTTPAGSYLVLTVLAYLGMFALVVTHHVTAFAFAFCLLSWTILTLAVVQRRTLQKSASQFLLWYGGLANMVKGRPRPSGRHGLRSPEMSSNDSGTDMSAGGAPPRHADTVYRLIAHRGPGFAGIVMIGIMSVWMLLFASISLDYLATPLIDSLSQLQSFTKRNEIGREFFSSGDLKAPVIEQLVAALSIILIFGMMPFGLWLGWRQHRANTLMLVFMFGAATYPLTFAFRLIPWGLQIASRSLPFVFLALAPILAFVIARVRQTWGPVYLRQVALVAWLVTVFCGGFVLGYPFWTYLPGRYLVSADTRSIESEGIQAAEWTKQALGPNQRMTADRINRLLLNAYGLQHLVTYDRDRVDIPAVYFSSTLETYEREIIANADLAYLLVDLRLATDLPMVGSYFDDGEPLASTYREPISLNLLTKFDEAEGVQRIFDSGNIIIYDTQRINNVE